MSVSNLSYTPATGAPQLFARKKLPAVKADFDHSKVEVKINRKAFNPMLGWMMTTPVNILSRCPVLTLPTGLAKTGGLTGIHLAGRIYRDEDNFRAGMAYEKAAGVCFADPSCRPKLRRAR